MIMLLTMSFPAVLCYQSSLSGPNVFLKKRVGERGCLLDTLISEHDLVIVSAFLPLPHHFGIPCPRPNRSNQAPWDCIANDWMSIDRQPCVFFVADGRQEMAAHAFHVTLSRAEGISRNLVHTAVHVTTLGLSVVFVCGGLCIK